MWKSVLQVFKLKVCERKFFNLFKVSTFKFEKVCGRKFFELLRVSTFKFEVCGRKVFKLLKASSVSKRGFLPFLQVLSEISSLCNKQFQVFEGFLVKVLFYDI